MERRIFLSDRPGKVYSYKSTKVRLPKKRSQRDELRELFRKPRQAVTFLFGASSKLTTSNSQLITCDSELLCEFRFSRIGSVFHVGVWGSE